MLPFILATAISMQCFVDQLESASRVEITKPFKINVYSKPIRNRRFLEKLYRLSLKKSKDGDLDVRYFALAWMESRLRQFPKLGDRGSACGIYQIHARYSYPLFRRRKGFSGWDEKAPENKRLIRSECARLRGVTYAVDTLSKLLNILDDKNKPACHHNSGPYGSCNTWYEERVNFWIAVFETTKLFCDERVQKTMAMMRTGSPTPTAPTDKVQGYLDFMAGKDPQKKEDEVYMSGYNLAEKVKSGEETAPAWAV